MFGVGFGAVGQLHWLIISAPPILNFPPDMRIVDCNFLRRLYNLYVYGNSDFYWCTELTIGELQVHCDNLKLYFYSYDVVS